MTAVVLRGDARSLPLPDASVDLIVTSPPYWSQRDYRDDGESLAGQIGSEPTWQEYLANLLDCTREWVRVLKPAGSLFVNLGDKYTTRYSSQRGRGRAGLNGDDDSRRRSGQNHTGISEKSLLGLPSRYALACMDDLGLIWRRDNIWHKISALPESADDRCTTRHEYVHHFTRQPDYFSATAEIREPQQSAGERHNGRSGYAGAPAGIARGFTERALSPLGKLPGSVWEIAHAQLHVPEHLEHRRCCGGRKRPGCEDGLTHHAAFPPALARKCILGWSPRGICVECGEGRFPVTSGGRQGDGAKPYKAVLRVASFDWAAWKESEPVRIIGYACACTPFTDRQGTGERTKRRDYNPNPATCPQGTYGRHQAGEYERVGPWREYHFTDWRSPPTRPALVVDPFGGTGTTAMTADVLGRNGISFDLSADYCRLATWRVNDPGERAKALGVPKPPPVPDGQASLFDLAGEAS